jgi:two-component system CheB/CheR fusion protein
MIASVDEDRREQILSLVAGRRGIDFRDYRLALVDNGLHQRLAALALPGLDDYRRRLEDDPAEMDALLRALVVPFTGFFRDAGVFEALAATVLPGLRARGDPMRVWAAGVATGEEAWSIAMLLADAGETPWRFEVVASDVDAVSLQAARLGVYGREAAALIPPALRAQFVEERDGDCRISDRLRRHVHFAEHDLMGRVLAPREAVLASFVLVLVRNVLIYFDHRLQHKALERLAAVLEPGGALVLGETESVPVAFAGRFAPYPGLDGRLRVYQRTEEGG